MFFSLFSCKGDLTPKANSIKESNQLVSTSIQKSGEAEDKISDDDLSNKNNVITPGVSRQKNHPELQTIPGCIKIKNKLDSLNKKWEWNWKSALKHIQKGYEYFDELTELEFCECSRYFDCLEIYGDYNDAPEIMEAKFKQARKEHEQCVIRVKTPIKIEKESKNRLSEIEFKSKPIKWEDVELEYLKIDVPEVKEKFKVLTLKEFIAELRELEESEDGYISKDNLELINSYYRQIIYCLDCDFAECDCCKSMKQNNRYIHSRAFEKF